MEQKKILWIVVAVSLFVLIIFGFALVLYAPSRSTGPNLQQAVSVPADTKTPGAANTPTDQSQQQLDPDSWVREPGTTPGLDPNQPPSQGNINLTIVNGDNTAANYGTLDVSGLTTPQTQQAIPPAPADNSVAPDASSGTDKVPQTSMAPPAPPRPNRATPQKAEQGAPKAKQPASKTEKATPVKAEPKQTVIEYWIQTGSFSSKQNAEKSRDVLVERHLTAEIFTKDAAAGATSFRVRVGPYKTKAEAEYWLGTVKEMTEYAKSYISEVKTKK